MTCAARPERPAARAAAGHSRAPATPYPSRLRSAPAPPDRARAARTSQPGYRPPRGSVEGWDVGQDEPSASSPGKAVTPSERAWAVSPQPVHETLTLPQRPRPAQPRLRSAVMFSHAGRGVRDRTIARRRGTNGRTRAQEPRPLGGGTDPSRAEPRASGASRRVRTGPSASTSTCDGLEALLRTGPPDPVFTRRVRFMTPVSRVTITSRSLCERCGL